VSSLQLPADDVRDGFDLTFQVLGVVIDVEFDGYEDDAAFVFSLLPEADVSLVPDLVFGSSKVARSDNVSQLDGAGRGGLRQDRGVI